MRILKARKGAVLVFALWVLTFLTVIAVSVASGVRQKILLIKRLDERHRELSLQQAGIRFAAALIHKIIEESNGQYSVDVKKQLHNDGELLHEIKLGEDIARVVIDEQQGERFGVEDEEAKINLNYASSDILRNLLELVTDLKPEATRQLTRALIDWRQEGSSQQVGFFSDEYYRNLVYSYPKKDKNYESMEELLLVEGMTKELFDRIRPFVTIYGEGKININTASSAVLQSIGFTPELANKVIQVRRGKDESEYTSDDYVFLRTFDIAIEINAFFELTQDEIKTIDFINAQNLLTTNSYYFTIITKGNLANGRAISSLKTIYGVKENRLFWWREKF